MSDPMNLSASTPVSASSLVSITSSSNKRARVEEKTEQRTPGGATITATIVKETTSTTNFTEVLVNQMMKPFSPTWHTRLTNIKPEAQEAHRKAVHAKHAVELDKFITHLRNEDAKRAQLIRTPVPV